MCGECARGKTNGEEVATIWQRRTSPLHSNLTIILGCLALHTHTHTDTNTHTHTGTHWDPFERNFSAYFNWRQAKLSLVAVRQRSTLFSFAETNGGERGFHSAKMYKTSRKCNELETTKKKISWWSDVILLTTGLRHDTHCTERGPKGLHWLGLVGRKKKGEEGKRRGGTRPPKVYSLNWGTCKASRRGNGGEAAGRLPRRWRLERKRAGAKKKWRPNGCTAVGGADGLDR